MPEAEPAARRSPPSGDLVVPQRRAPRGSAPWGVLGQVVNAATNVVTLYAASLLLDPARFGTFALAFATVMLVLGTGRGLVGATMMVELPTRGPAEAAALIRSALGFTVLVGIGAAALLALGTLAHDVLWAFVPWVAMALLQDAGRYVFLATGRAASALALDAVWALVQGAVIAGGTLLADGTSLTLLATAWGLGATAGVGLFALLHGARAGSPALWSRTTRDVAGWFTAASVLGQVEVYLTLVVAGLVLSAADVGGLRAVQLLIYQPATVLLGALLVAVQPMVVQARGSRPALVASLSRIRWWVAPVIAAAALGALLGGPLMTLLFPRYTAFADLVVPLAVQVVFLALAVPALAMLRGLRRGADVAVTQLLRVLLTVLAAGTGAFLHGPLGLAWGLAAASAVAWAQTTFSADRGTRAAHSGVAEEVSDDRPTT